jgi:hypothetical protein
MYGLGNPNTGIASRSQRGGVVEPARSRQPMVTLAAGRISVN